ncbi:MAG: hypothetical protein ABF382_07175, partial [Akkermansiaceae bacterium]
MISLESVAGQGNEKGTGDPELDRFDATYGSKKEKKGHGFWRHLARPDFLLILDFDSLPRWSHSMIRMSVPQNTIALVYDY